jgi:3',5'-cyclic AMP phosphodiesterase CpdA
MPFLMDKRKSSLVISAIMTLIILTGCTMEAKGQEPLPKGEDLRIVVATDIHYLSPKLRDGGEIEKYVYENGDGKEIGNMDLILDAFTEDLRKDPPDVLVVTGDLTLNGEKKSHEDLAKIFRKIESYGIQVIVTPGNHDISNSYARGFKSGKVEYADTVSLEEFESIYLDFGFKDAVRRAEGNLSYLYKVSEDLYIAMVDSAVYKNNIENGYPATEGIVSQSSKVFLEESGALARENEADVIVAMHHNMMNHTTFMNSGFTLENADEMRLLFRTQGFKVNLSGHIHIQDIHFIEEVTDIVTGAMSVYPNKYGIIDYSEGMIEYSTKWVDVEGYAKEKGKSEHLNFMTDARERFKAFSTVRLKARLQGIVDEASASKLTELLGEINAYYFAGEKVPDSVFDDSLIEILPEDDRTRFYIEDRKSGDLYENNSLMLDLRK